MKRAKLILETLNSASSSGGSMLFIETGGGWCVDGNSKAHIEVKGDKKVGGVHGLVIAYSLSLSLSSWTGLNKFPTCLLQLFSE